MSASHRDAYAPAPCCPWCTSRATQDRMREMLRSGCAPEDVRFVLDLHRAPTPPEVSQIIGNAPRLPWGANA